MDARVIATRGAVLACGLGVAAVGLGISACVGPQPRSRPPASPASQSTLEQSADCRDCHEPFPSEPLAAVHAEAEMACTDCHGPSRAHAADERSETPPDVVFKPTEVDALCRECHPDHDVAPARVIRRWRKVKAEGERETVSPTQARCTACHGKHRMARAKDEAGGNGP